MGWLKSLHLPVDMNITSTKYGKSRRWLPVAIFLLVVLAFLTFNLLRTKPSTEPTSDRNGSDATELNERIAFHGKKSIDGNVETVRPLVAKPTDRQRATHQRMINSLAEFSTSALDQNVYLGSARADQLREALRNISPRMLFERYGLHVQLGSEELKLGNEMESIRHYQEAIRLFPKIAHELSRSEAAMNVRNLRFHAAVACLRWGETQNCCQRNTPESCVFPIRGKGIHSDKRGSQQAIRFLSKLLNDKTAGPTEIYRAKWLLNLAHMTLGDYPQNVPAKWLIAPAALKSDDTIPRFVNTSNAMGLDTFSLAGGAAGDDFDGDGDLDLIVSTWHPEEGIRFFRNLGRGQFRDDSKQTGLDGINGGLNMVQADYDNDGDIDIFVLRGGWWAELGRFPNSLLQNLGDGTFVDVTYDAGLADPAFPSQTASWGDYNNDGNIDLFVGNEHGDGVNAPSQLFRNNGDGTFKDVATEAGVLNHRFAKAVIWGDFNNDRYPDLYVSNLNQENRLYKNCGDGTFVDVAVDLGVHLPKSSFPAWFFDYDNDGHLDLYVSSYNASAEHLALAYSGGPARGEHQRLYRNDQRGRFTNVTQASHLVRPTAPMGSNFGDLDNDGYLDIYLGTGSPPYHSLMPNVMYRNQQGNFFDDVTTAGGFGSLQKGHAVVFADFDEDGDQDIFEQMGGAYLGDRFYDAYYENPGFQKSWIKLRLVGVRSNRSAIGARIHVITENDSGAATSQTRSIYKHVNSGGSFGCSPLTQTIGLGDATGIKRVEVYWPVTGRTQIIKDIKVESTVEIVENVENVEND